MAKDLTIRLLGRPTVTEDSQLGFDRISRKYVVEGPRASKAGIIEATNPLFLGVGTPDEEFTDHLLVNQRIEPAQGSMDKAYLVRDFVNIRDTWNSESTSESGDLKKLTRRFVVLRAEHARGYDATSWASHPHNSDIDENDPWDYLPKVIKDTEPVAVSYEDNAPLSDLFSNAADHPSGLKPPKVSINSTPVSLANILTSISATDNLDIRWLRATAQVDISNPGVDVWSVSWAAPVTDHWVSGPGGGGKFKSNYPSLVEFDHNGLKVMKFGAVSGGGGPSHMETYVSYVVGETAGDAWYNYFSLGQLNPSVSMDFQFTYKAGGSETFKQHIPNAVYMYNTDAYLSFPKRSTSDSTNTSGEIQNGIRVAEILPLHMIFKLKDTYYTTSTMEPTMGWDENGDEVALLDEDGEPVMWENVTPHGEIIDARGLDIYYGGWGAHYQRKRLSLAGGHLSWSHPIDRSTIDQYSQNSGSSIRPIFSHGKERIWKIALSFVS